MATKHSAASIALALNTLYTSPKVEILSDLIDEATSRCWVWYERRTWGRGSY